MNTLLEKTGEGIYFLNSINPFRIEGQKTTMFELLDQLDWKSPDYLIVPGGNLGNSAAFGKAFDELLRYGFIAKAPRMIVVQAAGANPFAQLWRDGAEDSRQLGSRRRLRPQFGLEIRAHGRSRCAECVTPQAR